MPIRATASSAATQSGKPVNGRFPEPTVVSAPRTPPTGVFPDLPADTVAVTPRTPPFAAATESPGASVREPFTVVVPVTDVEPFCDVIVCVDVGVELAHDFAA